MIMPFLNEEQKDVNMITAFGGYNHNISIGENEFYDMQNMTSDYYPLASARDSRKYPEWVKTEEKAGFIGRVPTTLHGMTINNADDFNEQMDAGNLPSYETYNGYPFLYATDLGANSILVRYGNIYEVLGTAGKDNMIIVTTNGTKVYICEYDVETETKSYETEVCDYVATGTRQIIEMGANVLIFPEKYIVNTVKKDASHFTDIKPMEYSKTAYFNVSLVDINYHELTVESVGTTPPSSLTQYQIWCDTSTTPATAKRYSEETRTWATVQPYLEFSATIDLGIEEGDAVSIDGLETLTAVEPVENQKYYVVAKTRIVETGTTDYRYYIPVAVNDEFENPTSSPRGNITFTRELPVMDYVTESQNRLWGCRYGEDADGEIVNEIFASKLGDACNFHYFANTSIDSYYVSLGTDGAFTGAFTYQNNPVFAKRDCLHRVFGNYPSNYQVSTMQCYGIKAGCHNSAHVLNDVAYYYSPVGMVAYTGALPTSIAEYFGGAVYSNVITGGTGNKLYVNMQDEDDVWNLFVWDDSKALWHKEDDLQVKTFCEINHELLCFENDDTLISLGGVYGTEDESSVEWSLTSGDIGYTNPYRKRLLRAILRLKADITTRARVMIEYDGDGVWHSAGEIRPTGRFKTYAIPIAPQRCDYFKIKIQGTGTFKLLSIAKVTTQGSEFD